MRVLVVEDDVDSLLMLTTALEAQGYLVDQAKNGLLALEKLKQNIPDLVITDILMPEMDGYALCRSIKNDEAYADIPVVIYTATYVDAGDESLGLSVGASRFLIKPLGIDLFLGIVKDVISEQQSGLIAPKSSDVNGEKLDEMHVDRLTKKLTKKVVELHNEQRALELSEARFRDFAETAADWFWETDAAHQLVYTTSYSTLLVGSSLIDFLAEARNVIFDEIRYEERAWNAESELDRQRDFRELELEWGEVAGQERVFKVSGRPVYDDNIFMGFRGVCRDVTEATRLSRRIEHEASHDSLTGLINRSEFEERLKHAVKNHQLYGTPYQLCFMDLDQFKVVNDTAGHIAGDEMLRQISALMLDNLRHRDTLARLGGDEFGLLFENCPQKKAIDIAEVLVEKLSEYKFTWDGQRFNAGVSVGIVEISGQVTTSTELLSQADVACYAAKDAGRNRVSVYHGEGDAYAAHEEMFRAARINDVLDSGKLVLHVQPIIPKEKQDPVHLEFLIRLLGENGVLLTPDEIIPAAERYGVMSTIDRWVVKQVLKIASEQFTRDDDIVISINLSGKSFGDSHFLDELVQLISSTALLPEQICFEITETEVVTDLSSAIEFMNKLKTQGCKFALDDFGSGACSFTYLKELPVDYVKIDGSFVKDIANSPVDRVMVESVVHIARVMGIKTIAECVESEATNEILREIGVDFCQGYLHGKPNTLNKVMAQLS